MRSLVFFTLLLAQKGWADCDPRSFLALIEVEDSHSVQIAAEKNLKYQRQRLADQIQISFDDVLKLEGANSSSSVMAAKLFAEPEALTKWRLDLAAKHLRENPLPSQLEILRDSELVIQRRIQSAFPPTLRAVGLDKNAPGYLEARSLLAARVVLGLAEADEGWLRRHVDALIALDLSKTEAFRATHRMDQRLDQELAKLTRENPNSQEIIEETKENHLLAEVENRIVEAVILERDLDPQSLFALSRSVIRARRQLQDPSLRKLQTAAGTHHLERLVGFLDVFQRKIDPEIDNKVSDSEMEILSHHGNILLLARLQQGLAISEDWIREVYEPQLRTLLLSFSINHYRKLWRKTAESAVQEKSGLNTHAIRNSLREYGEAAQEHFGDIAARRPLARDVIGLNTKLFTVAIAEELGLSEQQRKRISPEKYMRPLRGAILSGDPVYLKKVQEEIKQRVLMSALDRFPKQFFKPGDPDPRKEADRLIEARKLALGAEPGISLNKSLTHAIRSSYSARKLLGLPIDNAWVRSEIDDHILRLRVEYLPTQIQNLKLIEARDAMNAYYRRLIQKMGLKIGDTQKFLDEMYAGIPEGPHDAVIRAAALRLDPQATDYSAIETDPKITRLFLWRVQAEGGDLVFPFQSQARRLAIQHLEGLSRTYAFGMDIPLKRAMWQTEAEIESRLLLGLPVDEHWKQETLNPIIWQQLSP